MADIDNQNKKGGGALWPWVLGLLAVAALIWAIAGGFGDDTPGLSGEISDEVEEYVSFIEGEPEMGRTHEYTATGLRHLADALDAVVETVSEGDAEIEATRDKLVEHADRIQQDPQAGTHARTVQEAFTAATDLMGQLEEKRFSGLDEEVSQAEQAAQALDPAGQLLEQQPEVERFFTAAKDVLQQMSLMSDSVARR